VYMREWVWSRVLGMLRCHVSACSRPNMVLYSNLEVGI
jgi:hypothetical protein